MTNEEWFEAFSANLEFRRELIWLRSKACGNEELAAWILTEDPDVPTRLKRAGMNLDQDRVGFAILYDIRELEIEDEILDAQWAARRSSFQ